MPVTVVFEPGSALTVVDIAGLVDFLTFDAEIVLGTETATSFVTGGFYKGLSVAITVTGTGLSYFTAPGSSFLTGGQVDEFAINYNGSETVTVTDVDIDFAAYQVIADADLNTNPLAIEEYLMQKTWDFTLSDNADIAPKGTLIWDGAPLDLLGDDIVRGQGGNDDLFTGAGSDTLFGGAGADTLNGGAGVDKVLGGSGNDYLIGEGGNDRMFGGVGHDKLFAGGGNDRLFGGNGNDRMYGGNGNDRLVGQGGDDRLFGGAGAEALYGGAGQDRLYGGAGWDTLVGGKGDDRLEGGGGSDIFVFSGNDGDNVIVDFDATDDNEVLDYSAVVGFYDFGYVSANYLTQVGNDVVIQGTVSTGLTVTLVNTDMSDLDANDFIFRDILLDV